MHETKLIFEDRLMLIICLSDLIDKRKRFA